VRVLAQKSNGARIGIDAPKEVHIVREEISHRPEQKINQI
jgi:sRNA-binding carbon storage regulator CsrA